METLPFPDPGVRGHYYSRKVTIDKVDEIAGGAVIALDRGGRMVSPATGTVKHGWIDQDGDVAVRITIE